MIINYRNGSTVITGAGHIKGLPEEMQPPKGTICKCGEHEATWWEEDKTEPNGMFFCVPNVRHFMER